MSLPAKKLQNIVCFTGENSFALREEQRRWRERFVEKYDAHNFLVLDGADLTVRTLLDEVGVAPFLAERRLVFVQGIPRFSREEMEALLANIHLDVVLVFVDKAPDRRLGGVKALLMLATVHHFPPLHGAKLMAWMQSIPASAGLRIEEEALRALIACCGENQESLYHELKKLSLFAGSGAITRSHVEAVAVANADDGMVWRLGELMGGEDPCKALLHIQDLLERGEGPFRLWTTLLWMLRCFLQAASLMCVEKVEEHVMAQRMALRPQMARACCAVARSTDILRLRDILQQTLDADRYLKTGEHHASAAEPGELLALVDQLVLRIAGAMGEEKKAVGIVSH